MEILPNFVPDGSCQPGVHHAAAREPQAWGVQFWGEVMPGTAPKPMPNAEAISWTAWFR